MPEEVPDTVLLATPPDQPAYRPFPDLARAIRSETSRILDEWRRRTLLALPELGDLSIKQFRDDVSQILQTMADALESSEPPDLRRLVRISPMHGFERFTQNYDLADLFAEERVLRRVVVERVEKSLGNQCKSDESAALHFMIDIMLQQGVLALVQQQKQELRANAEAQLKYLSFLSHDISNNFLSITFNLKMIQGKLAQMPQMQDTAESIEAVMETMRRTRSGMRRLLEHEQLRSSNSAPVNTAIQLRDLAETVIKVAQVDARRKGLKLEFDIDHAAVAETNADLVAIILQNLIGNAIKHTSPHSGGGEGSGVVQLIAELKEERGHPCWNILVKDDGPGIPPEKIAGLFDAFKTTPEPGKNVFDDEQGFGLGLAIAFHAARLLGTSIEVKTELGKGSTFSFCVPAPGSDAVAAS